MPEENEFVDLVNLKKLSKMTERLLLFCDNYFDYAGIADDIVDLSGAKYACLNLYDDDGKHFSTVALSGVKGIMQEVNKMLGFDILGAKWEHDLVREAKIMENPITTFRSLSDLTGKVLPKAVVRALEKLFNISEVVFIKIVKNDIMLGDFTLFFADHKKLKNAEICEIYSRQVGLVILQKKAETNNNNYEEKLTEIEHTFRSLFEKAPVGIAFHKMLYDKKGKPIDYLFLKVNDTYKELTGINPFGMLVTEAFPGIENDSFGWIEVYSRVAKNGETIRFQRYFENNKRWYDIVCYQTKKDHFATVFFELTELKKNEEDILYTLYHDRLTELYNRKFFDEEIERISKSKSMSTVMVGDINGLKYINDNFGRAFGDEMLKKVARIFVQICMEKGKVSRIGEDEFAVVLLNTSYDEAVLMINEIRSRCEAEIGDFSLGISFGIATNTDEKLGVYDCFSIAETRMYTAKLLDGKSSKSKLLDNLSLVLEERSGETFKHCARIAKKAEMMASELKLRNYEIENLRLLSLLHDIGKTAIPDSVLIKTSQLNDEEISIMKTHCEVGSRIACTIPELSYVAEGILSHHERWDGTGYPNGLSGKEIPLISRIISVIDSYDAMTNERPYRMAFSEEHAVNEIKSCAGTQFDPDIANVFIERVLCKK